jgi:branched-chain amino acid transport system substrate-binding protein
MKSTHWTLLGILLAVCAAMAPPAAAQSGGQPFKLLFIGALSGPAGPVGKFELAGFQASADEVNSRGGILGRKIEVSSEDSAGQGTRAVSILQEKLSSGQKPDAVIAGAISNETLAILPVTSQNKIMTIAATGATPANNPSLYPYNFQATLAYAYFADFLAGYLKGKGYKKIGLLTSNDANGQATAKAEKDGMEKAGLTVVAETFSTSDLDLTAPVQRIADAKPDAFVFATLLPTSAPLVLEARYKIGFNVPTYSDVNMNADLAALVPADRQKGVYLAHMKVAVYQEPGKRSALFSRFLEGVKKESPIIGVLLTPSLAWDNVQAMSLAFNQAGTTDPDKVKAAYENLRLPSDPDLRFVAFKRVRFSPSDHFNMSVSPEDFTVIPLGPRVEGAYKP